MSSPFYNTNYSLKNYKTTLNPTGILSICDINISTGNHNGRIWNFNFTGIFSSLIFSVQFQFEPNTSLPNPGAKNGLIPLDVVQFLGQFQGVITIDGKIIQLSNENMIVKYIWDNQSLLFTIEFNLEGQDIEIKEKYNILSNIWIKDCSGCKRTTIARTYKNAINCKYTVWNRSGQFKTFFGVGCDDCGTTVVQGCPILPE
jgi:hypothetical protein